ncbi:MAG: protoporphyrinogen oxidase [Planctomycetia bacterium]|nr:protoporphyrinogen oxidase [Planctomycetia bacterium]
MERRSTVFTYPRRPGRIAVIGSGISGLSAAHRILRLNGSRREEEKFQCTVFESSSRVGGVISTRCEEGFLVEESSDNFITTTPWAVQLCDELGLRETLTGTSPSYRRTFVVRKGRLRPLPDGFLMMAPTRIWPMALTPILSPFGKLRAAMEFFLPRRRDTSDESVRAFATRRLGREVFERLIEPLVSGVYAADMDRLSVDATLPQFREMEQRYGSLIRAMRANMAKRRREEREARRCGMEGSERSGENTVGTGDTGARYSLFMTPRNGLESMTQAIRLRLESAPEATIRLNTGVDRIEWEPGNRASENPRSEECPAPENRAFVRNVSAERESDGKYRVFLTDGTSEIFDGVILATPSHQTASIVRELDPLLSSEIAGIVHSGTTVLTVAFREDQVRNPPRGAGAVVPSIERLPILAISFSNRKYPFRAPTGTILLRIFAGGARHEHFFSLEDSVLRRTLLDALRPLLSIEGDPIYGTMARWPRTMPQYHLGHRELVASIRARVSAHPALAIAGNFLDGVGIPHCVRTGWLAAEHLCVPPTDLES